MVKKSQRPIYEELGNGMCRCTQCHRVFNAVLKVAVHVYRKHPHLRVAAPEPIKTAIKVSKISDKPLGFLNGLLMPKKMEAFRKQKTAKKTNKKSGKSTTAVSAASVASSKRTSTRVMKKLTAAEQIKQAQALREFVTKGKLNQKASMSATPATTQITTARGIQSAKRSIAA